MADQPIVTIRRVTPAETANVHRRAGDPTMLADALTPGTYFDVTDEYVDNEASKGWIVLREIDGLVPWTFWVRPADLARAVK